MKITKSAAFALIAASMMTVKAFADPMITPPSGLDEGTQTKLTQDQIAEILPWATNSQTQLKDMMDMIKTMSANDTKFALVRGIQEVVLASAPRSTELLMRYVLNRALKVEQIIEKRTGPNEVGALDVENRVLRLSVEMATGYYQSDVDYLKSIQAGNKALLVPYARFGYQYAEYLMAIDQSIFNAKAQYDVAIMALGLLQWDLARDAKLKTLCASSIHKIYSFLQIMPETASDDDGQSVARLRQIRSLYKNVMTELQTTLSGVATDGEVQLPADPTPAEAAPIAQSGNGNSTQNSSKDVRPAKIDGKDCLTADSRKICVGDLVINGSDVEATVNQLFENGQVHYQYTDSYGTEYGNEDFSSLWESTNCFQNICGGDTVVDTGGTVYYVNNVFGNGRLELTYNDSYGKEYSHLNVSQVSKQVGN